MKKEKNLEHYFIEKEHKESDYFVFEEKFLNHNFKFKSCDDVFSKDRIDYGTKVLLETISKKVDVKGKVLDIGSGYGVIGIVLSKLFDDCKITMCDINQTGVDLSKNNIELNNAKHIENVFKSDAYENVDGQFDFIITNPPIKAGKDNLLKILVGSHEKLTKGGKLIFVIKKKHGEDSIRKRLLQIFESGEILARDSGYYILCFTK